MMKLKLLFLLAVISLFKGRSFAQEYLDVPETNPARLYVASFRIVNATHPYIFCGK